MPFFVSVPVRATAGVAISETAWFEKGLAASQARNFPQATRIFEYLARIRPEKAIYWLNLGNARFLAGNHAGAVPAYQRVIQLRSPISPVASLYLSRSQRLNGAVGDAALALLPLKGASLPANLARQVREEISVLQEELSRRSLEAFRAEEPATALRLADQALSLGPSNAGQLLRGMVLVKKGDHEVARRAFREAYAGASDEGQRKDARDLFYLASPAYPGRARYNLILDLSTGYGDNVFASSDSDLPTASPIATVSLLYNQGPFSVAAIMDETVGFPDERSLRLSSQWSFLHQRGTWSAVLIPQAQLELRKNQLFLSRFGIGAGIETQGKSAFGAYGQISRSLPMYEDAAYLLGYTAVAKFYWALKTATGTASLALLAQRDGGPDLTLPDGILPLAGESVGPVVALSWSFRPRWELHGFFSYLFHSYDGDRADRQFGSGGRMSYEFGKGSRVYFSSQFVQNRSTLDASSIDDRNYSQWVGQAGFTWEFLQ